MSTQTNDCKTHLVVASGNDGDVMLAGRTRNQVYTGKVKATSAALRG